MGIKGLHNLNDTTAVMSSNEYESCDIYSLKMYCEIIDIVTSTGAFVAQEYVRYFFRLDQDAVVDTFKVSKLRDTIFDLNEIFVLKEPPSKYFKRNMFGSSKHTPTIMVCQTLKILCEDPNNKVFVVFVDSKEKITNSVGNIRNLVLA